jgi:hypothetical protein
MHEQNNEKIIERQEEVANDQRAFKNERLERGSAFEGMIRTDGWKHIQSFIENSVRDFANRAILTGFADDKTFNFERGKVFGMRMILSEIEASVALLENERKATPTPQN